ncbi:hypothetical protein Fcan01_18449 [Folsomia candida]|uniref:Uncharacterized protein n=1 Tax=Folsomia candida TaxID=158441 RepID=A0A226DPX0_FOLCA|nr:hypothetical protein Fcan01_18449 [Folsomia candida]
MDSLVMPFQPVGNKYKKREHVKTNQVVAKKPKLVQQAMENCLQNLKLTEKVQKPKLVEIATGGVLQLYLKKGCYMFDKHDHPTFIPKTSFVLMNDTGRIEFDKSQLLHLSINLLKAAMLDPELDLTEFKTAVELILRGGKYQLMSHQTMVQRFDANRTAPLNGAENIIKTMYKEYIQRFQKPPTKRIPNHKKGQELKANSNQ